MSDEVKTEETKNADQIEKELLEKANANATDVFGNAATTFGLYAPKFFAGLNKLSSRQLRRLIRALIEVPFVTKMPQFRNQDEKEMFAVGENLLLAKLVMISHSFMDAQETLANSENSANINNSEGETK